MGFEKFKRAFEQEYHGESVWEFMDDYDSGNIGLNGQLVEDNDQISHDSYGNEDSKLERVFFFPDYDVYVMFKGTRCSYQGEEWDEYKEVKPVTVTVTKFE